MQALMPREKNFLFGIVKFKNVTYYLFEMRTCVTFSKNFYKSKAVFIGELII